MAGAVGLGFRGRLLLAMLSLVVVTALVLGLVFMLYLLEDEKQRASNSLEVAARVTAEIMDRRNELLIGNLEVLVDDFGFRSAIASRDQATIDSALANHAGRAGADIALVLDDQGRPLTTLSDNRAAMPAWLPGLLESAVNQGRASRIVSSDGQALQMFVVPVRGAGLRAWLAAGFELNDRFAAQLAELTGTDVLFLNQPERSADGALLAASRPRQEFQPLLATGMTAVQPGLRETPEFFARIVNLGDGPTSNVQAVLLIDRESALANYYARAQDLLLILLAAILVSGLVVLVTARALGRPVLELAQFATAIGEGRSANEPSRPRTRELQTLQGALTTMQRRVREREERILFNASHDELTGLANRKALNELLAAILSEGRPMLLASITLTRFQTLNDTLGFDFGDQVLTLAAERLTSIAGDQASLVARTGGNEFVLLTSTAMGPLDSLLPKLRDGLQASASIGDTPFTLYVAVAGLALPEHAQSLDQIRRRLKLTLSRAQQSPQQVASYQPGGDELHLRELTLTQDLRRSIANEELTVVYQPKVDMASANPVQVEALARWHHHELGFISPEEFILLAEQTGQIGNLTRFVLYRIARDLSGWHQQGLMIGAAINLSALDLSNPDLINDIRKAFDGQGIALSWLTFEVTESAFMSDTQSALELLEQLRALGATLSVDDFGTGYSSLSQLRQLPVQELKIDKSFVLALNQEHQDQLIVRSTIEMAHGLGLTVVAEGIENLESWRLLQGWGCDKGQGFYMARPMPGADLPQWAGHFRNQSQELRPVMTGELK